MCRGLTELAHAPAGDLLGPNGEPDIGPPLERCLGPVLRHIANATGTMIDNHIGTRAAGTATDDALSILRNKKMMRKPLHSTIRDLAEYADMEMSEQVTIANHKHCDCVKLLQGVMHDMVFALQEEEDQALAVGEQTPIPESPTAEPSTAGASTTGPPEAEPPSAAVPSPTSSEDSHLRSPPTLPNELPNTVEKPEGHYLEDYAQMRLLRLNDPRLWKEDSALRPFFAAKMKVCNRCLKFCKVGCLWSSGLDVADLLLRATAPCAITSPRA